MPTILLKKSDTASSVPTTSQLTNLAGGAEVAVNTADRRMYTMTSASAVVELGNNPTSLNITTGNLAFTSTAQRITGDMSNATVSNRLAFQTSTTNGSTTLNIIPNGTGTASQFVAHMGSDPANTSRAGININSTQSAALVFSDITGTGTYLPMTFYTGGSERMRLDTSGNLLVGTATSVGGVRLTSVGGGVQLSGGTTAQEGVRIQRATGYATFTGINNDNNAYNGLQFFAGASVAATITTTNNLLVGTTTDVASRSGTISDISGNVRAIPRVGSAKTSVYTLSITDVGQYVELGTSGGVDVPNGIFSTGDVVSVFNNTTGNTTISLTITTAYIAGTDSDKASVTLATRGVATVLFISNSVCVITGNVT